MKKVRSDELRREYSRDELGAGVRGKHFEAYRKGTNLVLLKPDLWKAFPTQAAVNEALRLFLDILQKGGRFTKPTRRAEKSGK